MTPELIAMLGGGASGFIILPEVRQTALAIVGFYFGSSQVK